VHGHFIRHLRVVLEAAVVQTGEDPHADEGEVGPVDGGESAEVCALGAADAVVAIGYCRRGIAIST
jgi:hypothetical protein